MAPARVCGVLCHHGGEGRPQTKAGGMLEPPSSPGQTTLHALVSLLPLITVKSDPVKAFFFFLKTAVL